MSLSSTHFQLFFLINSLFNVSSIPYLICVCQLSVRLCVREKMVIVVYIGVQPVNYGSKRTTDSLESHRIKTKVKKKVTVIRRRHRVLLVVITNSSTSKETYSGMIDVFEKPFTSFASD